MPELKPRPREYNFSIFNFNTQKNENRILVNGLLLWSYTISLSLKKTCQILRLVKWCIFIIYSNSVCHAMSIITRKHYQWVNAVNVLEENILMVLTLILYVWSFKWLKIMYIGLCELFWFLNFYYRQPDCWYGWYFNSIQQSEQCSYLMGQLPQSVLWTDQQISQEATF